MTIIRRCGVENLSDWKLIHVIPKFQLNQNGHASQSNYHLVSIHNLNIFF